MTRGKKPLLIGAHMSIAGGVYNALIEGEALGCTTIQIFTSNQRQWRGKRYSKEEVEQWHELLAESGIQKVMSHGSYLLNLGSPKSEALEKSRRAFRKEVERCHLLDVAFLNIHPGAALDGSREAAIERIIESLLECEDLFAEGKTTLLLETTAGQGSTIGWCFEEIGAIVKGVKGALPIGVCMDTCHTFAAGYDLRTPKAWEKTLEEFEDQVGLSYLKALHVNDSKMDLGSRRDRHANLGEGKIGLSGFKAMMHHPKIGALPLYLETPNGEKKWADEIALLRSFRS